MTAGHSSMHASPSRGPSASSVAVAVDSTEAHSAKGVFAGLDAFTDYRRLYAPGADVEAVNDDVYAAVQIRLAGSLVVSERELKNVVHSRSPERVARNAFDHVTLQLVHAGQLEVQTETGSQVLREGSLVLLDMTRPVRHVANAKLTTVSFPRVLLPGDMSASARLHGLALRGSSAAPLVGWLQSGSLGEGVERTLANALRSALQGEAGARQVSSLLDLRRDRVRTLLESTLLDQALSPDFVAQKLGLSRATLYRLFEPMGSIQRWRQGRRLLHFKAFLAFTKLPVSEAARRAGLANPAHASALFSKAFGLSPMQFRRALDGAAHRSNQAQDLSWLLENLPVLMLQSRIRDGAH
jgi:AraC-like DNA-binding protein